MSKDTFKDSLSVDRKTLQDNVTLNCQDTEQVFVVFLNPVIV